MELGSELDKLDNKNEVFAPTGDFEVPNKEFVAGPYYVAAEEVLPNLGDVPEAVAGDKESSVGVEFPVDRRDFMRLFGLGAAVGATACVRQPVEKAIPYSTQPIDQVPGVATHYASTCGACASACGIMVKTREGRPVKIEGNSEHPISQGGLCTLGQADLQALYHPERLKGPQIRQNGKALNSNWDVVYENIAEALRKTNKVGILTGAASGHRFEFLEQVLESLGASKKNLYTWEPNSLYAATAKAHELAFGRADLPRYELAKAHMIVGIGTDFQATGTSSVFHSKGFAKSRGYRRGQRGKFVQFESHLTVTGSTADEHHVIPVGAETATALLLVRSLLENAKSKGSSQDREKIRELLNLKKDILENASVILGKNQKFFNELASELLEVPSLIMAGSGSNFDEKATLLQLAAIFANILIGAYGNTAHFDKGWVPSPVRLGDFYRFMEDAAQLEVLFVIDSDPLFPVAGAWNIDEKLKMIPTLISIQAFPNDADKHADFILPGHHSLEAWGDEQPVAGFWSIRQPTVRPMTDSRQAEDILLWLLAKTERSLPFKDYHAYLMNKWQAIHKIIGAKVAYDTFFSAVLRRGFVGKIENRAASELKDVKTYFTDFNFSKSEGFTLIAPLDHRIHEGKGAHIPVLQEVGDSLTTIAWDTWIAMNPNTMERLGYKRNQLIKVTGPGGSVEVAIYPMPGIHPDAVMIPRGNGHDDERSTISHKNGVNPLKIVGKAFDPYSGEPATCGQKVELATTGQWYRLAAMQKHNDIANRKDIVKKITLADAKKKQNTKKNLDEVPDLFPKLPGATYRWGMSIDIDKCNGCGACMVACAVENNVPQVGRTQILLGREMHWIRLDRYFSGETDNPHVTFQPVMCQHCNHAPCEPVCPVFATTHDPEGLNAMTYNRCVGTRYCANACTYKVRRFNWWNYKWDSIGDKERGERLQDRSIRPTNPDVTVRTKGVMEKCTFCVQRLRDAKHKAQAENREIYDGEVQSACQQTCPMDAIVFGNLNDPNSRISKERKDIRSYLLLGGEPEHGHFGLKTLPNVNYMAEVDLKGVESAESHHSKEAKHDKH